MSAAVPALRFPGFDGDWGVTPLGPRTTKVGSGVTPKGGAASYPSEGIPLIRSQNVRDGRLELDDVAYIAEDTHARMSGTHVQQDDILLNITGASIGRSCVVPESVGPANVNQHVCIIRLDAQDSPAFVQQYLASPRGQKQIDDLQGGSGREGLNFENIRGFRVPSPSLPEQTKIAEFLGVVDAKLTALRRKKGGLETFKSGLMQQLFTQTLRFTRDDGTDFPDWEERTLEDVSSMQAGKFMAASEIRPFSEEFLFPCFGGNGLRGYVSQHNQDGQFALIGRQGALCGNVHFVSGKFYATEHAIVVSAKVGTIIGWLFHLLAHMQLNQYATGLAQPGLAADNLKKLVMGLPHPDEQRKIADALSALDAKINAVGEQIAQMQTFKQGLLQQMFV